MLSGKNILIGITGGIAAYKVCELIRMFKRAQAKVRVVCTPNALNFVTRLTLQTLSQNEVGVEEFNINNFSPEHISYAEEADVFVIAPASANTISKMANGMCDNLLTSIFCAFNKPVIIAPAMNSNMWRNPFVQDNLNKLIHQGVAVVPPESGFLACGVIGEGRLAEIQKIFDKTVSVFSVNKFLSGKRVVVTSGGTIEEIDPVRYISNYSSGKMGFALADEAYRMGAEVVLITTKDVEKPYKVIKVKSALDMKSVLDKEFLNSDYIFMAAAVADYRVKSRAEQKIKKTSDNNEISIELIKNPDILKYLCELKSTSDYGNYPIIVGFCAETESLIKNAKLKICAKGCDFLIANDVSRKDIGFSSDENEVYIINKNLDIKKLEKQSKNIIAREIIEEVYAQRGYLPHN